MKVNNPARPLVRASDRFVECQPIVASGTDQLEQPMYETIIYWSNDDQVFIADVPELPGCMAHGASPDEALANAQEAMQL